MENPKENIEEINQKIDGLRDEKNKIKKTQERKSRLRSNNCGNSNVIGRVSINFKNRMDFINDKREENGLDCLSYPKQTELMITHKKCSKIIENDIIRYNTGLDEENKGVEFNEK